MLSASRDVLPIPRLSTFGGLHDGVGLRAGHVQSSFCCDAFLVGRELSRELRF